MTLLVLSCIYYRSLPILHSEDNNEGLGWLPQIAGCHFAFAVHYEGVRSDPPKCQGSHCLQQNCPSVSPGFFFFYCICWVELWDSTGKLIYTPWKEKGHNMGIIFCHLFWLLRAHTDFFYWHLGNVTVPFHITVIISKFIYVILYSFHVLFCIWHSNQTV